MSVLYKTNVEESISNKPNASTAFNLAASATQADGLRNVLAAYADTEQLPYFVSDGAGLWEDGIGTVTGTTLVRAVINESSNSDSVVDFSGGGALTLIVGASAAAIQQAEAVINKGSVIVTADGTTTQTISPLTYTKVTNINSVVSDPLSWWNNISSEFSPNRPGIYLINALITMKNIDNGSKLLVFLYKNGVQHKLLGRATTGNLANPGISGMALVKLNGTTDIIDIRVYHDSTNPEIIYQIETYEHFSANFQENL